MSPCDPGSFKDAFAGKEGWWGGYWIGETSIQSISFSFIIPQIHELMRHKTFFGWKGLSLCGMLLLITSSAALDKAGLRGALQS